MGKQQSKRMRQISVFYNGIISKTYHELKKKKVLVVEIMYGMLSLT